MGRCSRAAQQRTTLTPILQSRQLRKKKKPTVGLQEIPEGESMAKSVYSLDAKTTVAPDEEEEVNSFDADSIESAESLQ